MGLIVLGKSASIGILITTRGSIPDKMITRNTPPTSGNHLNGARALGIARKVAEGGAQST